MVRSIRNIELSIGTAEKHVSPSERPNIIVARKSIVASKHIKAGELFSEDNITVKRPGNGVSPMLWDKVIGSPAPCGFSPDELITF
jgi:N,N'-diacetyllegionaminate synthase